MVIVRALKQIYWNLPKSVIDWVEDVRNALPLGASLRIRPVWSPNEGVFQLTDAAGKTIYVCRSWHRRLYYRGIMRRINYLANIYGLDRIDVTPNGVFIDCGANIGELGIWARAHGLDYVAFEPELPEAICCDLNNFDGNSETRRSALWKESTTIRFYSSPETADSSIIEVAGEFCRVEVDAVTLDSALDASQLSNVQGTVIFKLEAEGAEPEVLEGATKTLTEVDWVAIDCGYERGPNKEHTVVETNTFMYDQGFRLCYAELNSRRITALYRNTKDRLRSDSD